MNTTIKKITKTGAGELIVSAVLSASASVMTAWIYGYILVSKNFSYLQNKAALVEQGGGISVPPSHILHSLSENFLFNCGIFFGLPLGLFLWMIIFLIILVSKAFNIKPLIPLMLGGIASYTYFGRSFYPYVTAIFFLSIPFTTYAGYSLPAYVKNKLRGTTPFNSPFIKGELTSSSPLTKGGGGCYIYSISILCFILISLYAISMKGTNNIDYINIRDNLLLGNKTGSAINSFYYEHSPYAAEVIKPLGEKRQFNILYISEDTALYKEAEKYLHLMWLSIHQETDDTKINEYIASGGVDAVIFSYDLIKRTDIYNKLAKRFDFLKENSIVIIDKDYKVDEIKGYKNILTAPIGLKELRNAIETISKNNDQAGGIRKLLKFALFDYLPVTAALIIFILVLTAVNIIAFAYHMISKLIPSNNAGHIFLSAIALSIAGLCVIFYNDIRSDTLFRERLNLLAKNKKIGSIKGLYITSSDDSARYQAMYTLFKMSKNAADKRLVDTFLKGLSDPDPRVRMYSAEGLGNMKEKSAVPTLIELLKDPHLNVRYKAALSLGEIGDKSAIPPLKDRIEKDIWYISDYALSAIRKLG